MQSKQKQFIDKTWHGIKIMAGRYLAYGKVWPPKVSQRRLKVSLKTLSMPGVTPIPHCHSHACNFVRLLAMTDLYT